MRQLRPVNQILCQLCQVLMIPKIQSLTSLRSAAAAAAAATVIYDGSNKVVKDRKTDKDYQ